MSSLSEQDRKAYEAYILAQSEEERQEAIKKLIPGSHLYYHLFFIDRLKKVGSKLTEEDQAILAQFKKKYPHHHEYLEVEMKLKLLEYDDASTEEQRHKVISDLASTKFLNLNFDFPKPDDLQRHGLESSSSQADNDSQVEEEVQDEGLEEEFEEGPELTPTGRGGRVQVQNDDSYGSLDEDEREMINSNSYRPRARHQMQQMMRNQSNNSDIAIQQMNRADSYGEEFRNNDDIFQQQMPIRQQMPQIQQQIFNYQEQIQMDDDFMPQQQHMINQIDMPLRIPGYQGAQPRGKGFDYDRHFGKDKVMKAFKGRKGEDVYTSQQKLNQLPLGFEEKVDFTLYNVQGFYQWVCGSGKKRIADIQNETFYTALANSLNKSLREDKLFQIPQGLCDAMTLAQLDKLSSLHPKIKEDKIYIGSYFSKQFHEELSKENQEVWSNDEKRANLLTLYKYTKSKQMPQSLQSQLLYEILDLGVKLGIYDEELFMEFVKNPIAEVPQLFNKKKERKYNHDFYWNQYIGNVQSENSKSLAYNSTQQQLIEKYLEHFCVTKGSLESFKDEMDKKLLARIDERVKVYQSDDMTNLNIDLKRYQEVSQQVIISFLESNQEIFKVDEEVKLAVELKNVQTLYIKIFEFNTETYYKKTLQPFNTGVNLDGLIASIEKNSDYKHPPHKKFIETFTFPELVGKVGLFIVEFIGNGMSARAVIKKGSLSLIHKATVAGHMAYVLDENKRICSGPKTGIQFDGQYYPADQEKGGKIFIPYGKSQVSQKAILMNNGFAQLCDFERLTEQYNFNAWIYLNYESLLIGTKAQIAIRPNLMINQRQAQLEVLKNTKVTLTTMNYIDSIPITKTFENIKFSNSKDHIIDFQVPAYLSQVTVLVETEVYNVTLQSKQKFSEQKTFQVAHHSHSHAMSELYLRKEKDDYVLYLLGKNGEPKPKVDVGIMAMHQQLKEMGGERRMNLKTDSDGKIKLGPLKKILALVVNISSLGIDEKGFMIHQPKQNLTYPQFIDAIENEVLEFPVLFNNISRSKISLIRKTDKIVLEDLFDKIEFVKQENKDYNLIRLKNLPDGQYDLNLKTIGKQIKITINKGQYWEGDSFILKRNCLFENNAPLKMIKIANVKVEDNKEGTQDITIQLDDFTNQTRIHAFATQFKQMVPRMHFTQLSKMLRSSLTKTVFPFAMWKNIFMSNRELSDEYRYVFDRKYAERFQGNTLERPRLLLKRNFFGNTQINHEALNQGTQYQHNVLMQEVQSYAKQNIAPVSYNAIPRSMMMLNSIAPKAQMIQQSIQPRAMDMDLNNCMDFAYDDYGGYDEGQGRDKFNDIEAMLEQEMRHGDADKISEFQNFLQNPPLTLYNLKPNDQGIIKFTAKLSTFSQLEILAVDNTSVAFKVIDLEVNPIQKRDLSLKNPLDTEKGFTESRTTLNIQKDETHFIEDITSTEIQLIDDLTKVKGVIEELMKSTYTNNGTYKELVPIVTSWPKLSQEEKLKMINKHFCNELNIHIYYKDRIFFDSIVKPFLKCKMEKRFLDYYLLEEYDKILHFASIEEIINLNTMEQCLFIDALVKVGKNDEAIRIKNFVQSQVGSLDNQPVEQKNKTFDTVLNLNMMKNDEVAFGGMDSIPAPSLSAFPDSLLYLQEQSAPIRAHLNAAPRQVNFNRRASYSSELSDSECEDEDDECEEAMSYGKECEMERKKENKPMMKKKMAVKADRHVLQERKVQKRQVKINFEEVQQTKQYIETHYYKVNNSYQAQTLIRPNEFWNDYAEYVANGRQGPFLSANFVQNSIQNVSALLAFALLDLPNEAQSHNFQTNQGRGVTIKAVSPIILFKKEVKEAPLELTNDIIVTHRYVALDNSSTSTTAMPEEFLVNKVYQCEVIMTNVSPQHKTFSVLYQIPQGSLPLQLTKYMKSLPQNLSPYTTTKVIFYFYFPKEGIFIHFPSSISENQKVVARSQAHQLKVVTRLSINKKETFRDIVMAGNKDDIIEFMRTHNLEKGEKGFNFSDILWMLKDIGFYKRVLEVLRQKFVYHESVWSFSFLHKDDEVAIREYIMRQKPYKITSYINHEFSCKIYSNTKDSDNLKHIDFYPMMNSRAHLVGETQNWTLNQTVKEEYEKFIRGLVNKKQLNIFDKFGLVYFFQLQDKITEAIQMFKTIDYDNEIKDETLRIQYDYMNAYFDFFIGEQDGFKVARAITRKYEDYPISQWRILFLEILDQLNEIDGEAEEVIEIDGEIMTEEQRKQKYKQSVKKEPRLDVEVSSENQKITIDLANIKQLVFKFYIIDAEILFSRTPFLQKSTEEFSYVKPCHVVEQELHNPDLNSSIDTVTYLQQGQKFDVEIPEHLKNQNMVIEINGDGKQIFKTYYSTQIQVSIIDTYGELKVTDKHGNPQPRVYVKVYAQKKGGSTSDPFFFKDGYTDIRGKFEYAQTSGNRLKEVQKFAIFVMSDTLGSIIKECNPPKDDSKQGDQGEEPGMNYKKEQRIISKVANWKAMKSKK